MKKTLLIFSVMISMIFITACCNNNSCDSSSNIMSLKVPERASGQKDVLGLAVAPIDTVRIGVIGVGARGTSYVGGFNNIEGAKVVAICDVRPERVEFGNKLLTDGGKEPADVYTGSEEAWKEMCQRDDIDLIFIATGWEMHTPMALYAMEQGKHVALEVPAAVTVEECWQLVDMAERKQLHCIMLENCCYDFFEMVTLNMAQQGLFGDIVHVEGAYIHHLTGYMLDTTANGYHNQWRLKFNREHDGNPYPTHGLGPVCQVLGIHRGDKMNYLVSMSSAEHALTNGATAKYGADSPEAKAEYKKGDMNVTLIKTAKGRTIMIQHDVASPRDYSRIHLVSGTKGFAQKWPTERLFAEGLGSKEEIMEKYEHPITKEYREAALKDGGHGGMDYIMRARLIYCLRNGLPLDMDVYDAAEWSSIVELSEKSVNNNSAPIEVPDFTRGAWNKVNGYKHAMK